MTEPEQSSLQQLLDKQAITELCYRYMRGLDRLDRDLLMSVFHADGWCEYGFINCDPAAFIDYALEALSSHSANQHFVGNILIDLDGDQAFGEVYFNAYHKVPSETGFDDIIIAGRYLDRYERRDNQWRFAYRSERVDWSRTQATADSYFELATDGLRGGRRDDAVYDTGARHKPTG
jgi:hypothetical protein